MTAVELSNLALAKIGVNKVIAATTDTSKEAVTIARHFDTVLRAALTQYPWSFATAYVALYLTQGPVYSDETLVQAWAADQTYAVGDVVQSASVNYRAIQAGLNHLVSDTAYWEVDEDTDDANGDWTYAYRWPSDCLFARRVLNNIGLQRAFDPNPPIWRKGRDANGLLIYSNQPDAELEYTVIDCDALYADDLFIDHFTWRLAAAIAPGLAQNGLTLKDCLSLAMAVLPLATTVDARQQEQDKPGDAAWISAR